MFITNVFNLAIIIGSLGFLYSGNRAIVLTTKPQIIKEYYGTLLIVCLAMFILISVGLIFYSVLDSNLHVKSLNTLLIYLLPVGGVFLLTRYFESLFQADNKIKLLAISRLFPKLVFFALMLLCYIYFNKSSGRLSLVWAMFFGSQAFVFLYIIKKIKPSFKNFKTRIYQIWKFNKIYGFNVYIGSLFATGFSQLTGILISYFNIDNVQVGYYALALTFASPLSLIPNIVATTNYKEFAVQKFISQRLIYITIVLTIISLFLLWAIIPFVIPFFYGKEYLPVVSINFILSIGVTFYAFSDFINRFLSAHGQGKTLRNCSFIVGLTLLLFNLILIPILGAKGAAYSTLITGIVYLMSIFLFYKKLVHKLSYKN